MNSMLELFKNQQEQIPEIDLEERIKILGLSDERVQELSNMSVKEIQYVSDGNYQNTLETIDTAGLSLCYGKMAEIKDKIDANKDTVKRNLTAQKQNRLSDGIGFFDEVMPMEKAKPERKKSNRDLLF